MFFFFFLQISEMMISFIVSSLFFSETACTLFFSSFLFLGFCQQALLLCFHVDLPSPPPPPPLIRPPSGRLFDVPVWLLGDVVMPVNNSTVPPCWTCVMPTVLAQQAAYFRGCVRLLLLASSGTENSQVLLSWILLRLKVSLQLLDCTACCFSTCDLWD